MQLLQRVYFFIHPVQPKFYDLLVINFTSITHAKLALSHMNIFCFNANAGDSDLTNKATQADNTTQGKMSAYYSDFRSKP